MTGDEPNDPGAYEFCADMPGMYHNRAAGFAFADGHSVIQRWLDPRTTPPLQPPVVGPSGATGPAVPSLVVPLDTDVRWLQLHTVKAMPQ
jgi:prepilin-type processing-associated H-X9-DG protein